MTMSESKSTRMARPAGSAPTRSGRMIRLRMDAESLGAWETRSSAIVADLGMRLSAGTQMRPVSACQWGLVPWLRFGIEQV